MEKLLIFDYDGTIHETMRIYEPAFRSTFAWLVENGWAKEREIPAGQVAGWLGMNSREMWQSFLPELPEPVQRKGLIRNIPSAICLSRQKDTPMRLTG